MSAAVYLAHEIEWNAAKDRARLLTARRPGTWTRLTKAARRAATAAEFDPHAATELAFLIERRMTPTKPTLGGREAVQPIREAL